MSATSAVRAVTTITHIGSSLFATLAVIVLTVMMLAEGPRWRRIFEQLIPNKHSARTQRLAHDMNRVIRGYVNGQVTLAVLASILIAPMLFILHISNPVALVVIVFICGLIPMVGHTIGAIIVTAVALFHSLTAAVIILAYYILYQQIENYVIQPRIQANATNMSALLVFISVLLGANFGGLLGALVAIPIAGCLRVAVLDYLENRKILSSAAVEAKKNSRKLPELQAVPDGAVLGVAQADALLLQLVAQFIGFRPVSIRPCLFARCN